MARESGWVVAEVTAGSGMLEDVEMRTRKGAAHLVEAPSKARVASIGIPNLMSIELDGRADESGNWRLRMERLLDQIEAAETGLLVTVDEVDGSLEDMVMLASVYQHFVREDRRAGLLMAGLPHNVSVLLNDKTVSFLRRAHLEPLSRISIVATLVATPIRTYLFSDGQTGVGADFLIAYLSAVGRNLIQSVAWAIAGVNLVDKVLSCAIAWGIVKAMPKRLRAYFPEVCPIE